MVKGKGKGVGRRVKEGNILWLGRRVYCYHSVTPEFLPEGNILWLPLSSFPRVYCYHSVTLPKISFRGAQEHNKNINIMLFLGGSWPKA